MTHFRAHWPIRDDSATLRDLAALALDEFAEMAHRAHVVIVGDIAWGVTENDEGDLTLTATAPVNPVTFGAYYRKRQKDLAENYGITDGQVSMIVRGIRWPNVGGPIQTERTYRHGE